MFTATFWRDAAERAVKTAAQSLLLVWPIADGALDLWDVDPLAAVGIAGGGAVLSLLTSIASAGGRHHDSGSALRTTFTASTPPDNG